jgi:predicted DNA-binding protein with PD1-like motif
MISFESRQVRHVVARLERGDRLQEALRALAEEHQIGAAWISALGAFESVELCEYDQEGQRYRPGRRVDTPVEIINLTGNISFKDGAPFAHVHATVSREKPDGIEVLGGHVVDATIFACEIRLDVYDDLLLGRSHDEATGLSLWADPEASSDAVAEAPAAAEASVPTSGGGVSWADVAQASTAPELPAAPAVVEEAGEVARPPERLSLAERRRRAKARQGEKKKQQLDTRNAPPARAPEPLPAKRRMTEDEFFEEPIPEPGDYVQHKVFGLCAVDGESETGGLIIRMENGVRKAIKLQIFEVRPPREDAEGRRIFDLVPKRRK